MLIIRSPRNAQRKRIRLPFGQRCLKAGLFVNAGPNEIWLCRSDVAAAPLELLPDYTEERCVGQGGQWKRFPCFADGDDRSAFNVDRSAAIQRQVPVSYTHLRAHE